jgi:hypothetical protein
MYKVIPICSEHGDELRQEHFVDDEGNGYVSGFCSKCAKHYRLCSTSFCIKKLGHDGEHLDNCGATWGDGWHGHL